jgi:aspartate 1-decarboxylase
MGKGQWHYSLNGPAALKFQVDDMVIVISYCTMEWKEAKLLKPTVVSPDSTTN